MDICIERTSSPRHFGDRSIGESKWRPHPKNALSDEQPDHHVASCGPDWSSSIRCAILPQDSEPTDLFTSYVRGRRHFPEKMECCTEESKLFSGLCKVPVQCDILGQILANEICETGTYLDKQIGHRARVIDTRGGIPQRSLGDKSYYTPEYSAGFHRLGSTRPVINFSRSNKVISDTFIPLQPLPFKSRKSFHSLEKRRILACEIEEVLRLDSWRPADPLKAGL